MRIEKDNLGSVELEDDILYGIQTKRALDNFKLDHKATSWELIREIITIKKAAAKSYEKLGIGDKKTYQAVIRVCDQLLAKKMPHHFAVESLQGGAGTSTNMNVNEVIANMTLIELGEQIGDYDKVHPLDVINKGQSTNDVYPTALRIAAIKELRNLSEACAQLQKSLQEKENEFDHIEKLGRTELMDAVPVTLGQEFGSFAQGIARDRWRLYKVEERLRQVNIGGTAVGSGNNAERKYRFQIIELLREYTGIGLAQAEYPMDITQNNDVFVEVSGLLKALAVNLKKISNDLRWMNSGPRGGLGEITIPAMQMGSTIMPGKVNPVILEMVIQIAIKVMSNDFAISMAASEGEFELNAFSPLIADSLLENLLLLTKAVNILNEKVIKGIRPNEERCKYLLEQSYAFATNYTPKLGYEMVNEIIKETNGNIQQAKQILEDKIKEK